MLDRIKNWIKIYGGRYVIVENGEPKFVIMSAEEYADLLASPQHEQINKEIVSLQEEVTLPVVEPEEEPIVEETIEEVKPAA